MKEGRKEEGLTSMDKKWNRMYESVPHTTISTTHSKQYQTKTNKHKKHNGTLTIIFILFGNIFHSRKTTVTFGWFAVNCGWFTHMWGNKTE